MSETGQIQKYLDSILESKNNIKQALIDMHAPDVGDVFSTYPDKIDEVDSMPRVDITLGNNNVVTVPIAEKFYNWCQTSIAGYEYWFSVCYGNGKFVAVAPPLDSGFTTSYSMDGINWTTSTMPTSDRWYSVCYGNGKFVAITGYNSNVAAYSTDGISWTKTTLPSSVDWYSVCYGNGKFVAVSLSNKAAYSTNGINWTTSTMPSSVNWTSVCYGNGKFVAVSASDKAAYSTDGISWTETTMPSVMSWKSICYGNGKFVAVASNSNIAVYSADGINWTTSNISSMDNWTSVCYGDGKFVAISSTNRAAYSFDGTTWNSLDFPQCNSSTYCQSICYGNGKFMVVAKNSSKAYYIDSNFGEIVRNAQELIPDESVTSVRGYTKDLVNNLTISGTYATSSYNYPADGIHKCISGDDNSIYLICQSHTTSAYENIYYTAAALPTGVTLELQTYYSASGAMSSTIEKLLYIAKFTGITKPVNVSVNVNSRNNSSDYYQYAVTITYV